MDRDFKGVWIPKDIWLNKNLSPLDKCLLAEIDSLDRENECFASNDYLAEFCQVGKATITRSIQKLCELGFITTETRKSSSGSYRVIKMSRGGSNQIDEGGLINLSTNYNSNNNINVLSKDNTSEQEFDFGNIEKPKTPNLYTKCMNLIDDYIAKNNLNPCIKPTIKEYLDVCMEMKCIRGANQWKGMLNTLENISTQTGVARGLIVQQSIEHGWKTFYPVNNFQPKNKCVDNVQSPKDNQEYHPVLDENGNPIVF